ncbi:putative 50S ribosomal protein L22, chloroplastic-like [Cocos nucifera]|uniref:Putative 50S ribosomal protein L22, chloroplastic-like n=1 Tax=Cocos nucifera TaxID=13894 RepID=A0A8K0HT35_COCNU|nr:putative 50S ribosomal protein L22, chloroplastic-like [Cocos nucifera]
MDRFPLPLPSGPEPTIGSPQGLNSLPAATHHRPPPTVMVELQRCLHSVLRQAATIVEQNRGPRSVSYSTCTKPSPLLGQSKHLWSISDLSTRRTMPFYWYLQHSIFMHGEVSPKKVKLVAKLVRGMQVEDAPLQLQVTVKRAARTVYQVIHSAHANAAHNHGLFPDRLLVDEAFFGKGVYLKRLAYHAKGGVGSR